jgi:ADP-ribose pyrophosphatase
MTSPSWSILAEEDLVRTPHLHVTRQHVGTPARPDGVEWYVVRRPAAVVVAPQFEDGSFLLIRQERPAVRQLTWEFPAGQVDAIGGPGDPHEAALRELREEAGLECPGGLLALGGFHSSVGFTDERAELFLARDCRPSALGSAHSQHEVITETRRVSPAELGRMVADGDLHDANSLCAFARMVAKGLLAPHI